MPLNQAQIDAIKCNKGPCLVLAGAGSGKTRVITIKIEYLIRNLGLSPRDILAVTFTNKAAGEMRERIEQAIGHEKAEKVTICTFHALGMEILRQEHVRSGLKQNFSIFDNNDQLKVLTEVIKDGFQDVYDENSRGSVYKALEEISLYKSRMVRPEQNSKTQIMRLFYEYQSYLQACNAVDFDDLIYRPTLLLQDNEDLRDKWQDRFLYVMVDEYQDTNTAQYQMLKILTAKHRNFTVVGDDDQSIYSWRGADVRNIKLLSEDFPDLNVVKLEQNYRSSQRILRCANSLIANNEHLFSKTIFSELDQGEKVMVVQCGDEDDEANYIAGRIIDRKYTKHCSWRDFAVLFRSNAQAQVFERTFNERNIPNVVIGGDSFFDQAAVKDMLAYCRLIANQDDEISLMRIINVPRRGIGKETLVRLGEFSKRSGMSSYRCAKLDKFLSGLGTAQQKSLRDFTAMIDGIRQRVMFGMESQIIPNLAEMVGYDTYLKQNHSSDKLTARNQKSVKTLLSWLLDNIEGKGGREPMTFKQAVIALTMRDTAEKDEKGDVNAVQLLTLHSSKGLEFPHVFLAGAEENTLPHKNSFDVATGIEEERRLAYVGITRAQQTLTITHRKRKATRATPSNHGSQNRTGEVHPELKDQLVPSRFLKELPAEEIIVTSSEKKQQKPDQDGAELVRSMKDMLLKSVGSAAFEKPR